MPLCLKPLYFLYLHYELFLRTWWLHKCHQCSRIQLIGISQCFCFCFALAFLLIAVIAAFALKVVSIHISMKERCFLYKYFLISVKYFFLAFLLYICMYLYFYVVSSFFNFRCSMRQSVTDIAPHL